jgi:hypothetical protein
VRGRCDGTTAGIFGEDEMVEPWDSVGTTMMAGTYKAQEGGFWVGEMLTPAVKPQWVCYKLDKTIEQPCSDFLAHSSKVCKGACRYNEYSAIQG